MIMSPDPCNSATVSRPPRSLDIGATLGHTFTCDEEGETPQKQLSCRFQYIGVVALLLLPYNSWMIPSLFEAAHLGHIVSTNENLSNVEGNLTT